MTFTSAARTAVAFSCLHRATLDEVRDGDVVRSTCTDCGESIARCLVHRFSPPVDGEPVARCVRPGCPVLLPAPASRLHASTAPADHTPLPKERA